jgi:cobalamin biosynthesis Mg chelatase CobN
LKRLVASLAVFGLALALVGPQTAFARMHFTTTNERLDALSQAANSSLALTDPAAIQTQINEITTQAQAAKAAAEDAAGRPASDARDKAVLATVATEMDAVVASANKAKAASGADQKTSLQDVQTRANTQSQAVKARIQEQLAAPPAQPVGSPATLPSSGQASTSGGFASLAALVGGLLVVGGVGAFGVARRRRSA